MSRCCSLLLLACLWALPAGAQPTIGGTAAWVLAADQTTDLTVATATTGSAVFVVVTQHAGAARTYSVADDEGTGNVYDSIENNSCGTTVPCVQVFADYSISAGDGTLLITVTQAGGGLVAHQAGAVEVDRAVAGTLEADVESQADNATETTHHAAPSGDIDTAANVFVFSVCEGDNNLGTKTDSDGAGATWVQLVTTASNVTMGQYRNSAGALTDERATMTSSSTRTTACAVVSVKETATGGASPRGTLLGVLP
jgi:hypothetical protein